VISYLPCWLPTNYQFSDDLLVRRWLPSKITYLSSDDLPVCDDLPVLVITFLLMMTYLSTAYSDDYLSGNKLPASDYDYLPV